jgi:hypothetical protein
MHLFIHAGDTVHVRARVLDVFPNDVPVQVGDRSMRTTFLMARSLVSAVDARPDAAIIDALVRPLRPRQRSRPCRRARRVGAERINGPAA